MLHPSSRNFIVLAHPRTGTNFLCHMLANRKDAYYLGEFYPEQKNGPYNIIEELFYGEPKLNLRWKYRLPEIEPRKGRFAKLFYYLFVWPTEDGTHSTRWDLLEYMKHEKIGVIHLRRKNVLDVALSYIRSKEEHNYIYHPYTAPIEIQPHVMAHHLWMADWQPKAMKEGLETSGLRHHEVWYDDLVADPQGESDRIADFLNRPRKEILIAKATKKQRQGSQRENILNYDQLKEHFLTGPYACYFED